MASTAENIALWFFHELQDELEKHRQEDDLWEVEEIILFETDKNIASIKNEWSHDWIGPCGHDKILISKPRIQNLFFPPVNKNSH